MRRPCTEQEKRILNENWETMCTGFTAKSAHSRVGDIFLILFVWMVISFTLLFTVAVHFGEWMMFFVFIGSYIFSMRLVNFLLLTFRVKRIKKKFLKKSLLLNGASVVEAEGEFFDETFIFVEDDEYLPESDHEPYGITVNAYKCDVGEINVGDWLLLLYQDDGQNGTSGDVSMQFMKMPPELGNSVLPEDMKNYGMEYDVSKLTCFPHPNAARLQKEIRELTSEEKEAVQARFLIKEKKTIRIIILVLGGILIGAVNLMKQLLLESGTLKNGTGGMALLIQGVIYSFILLLCALFWRFLNQYSEKQMQVTHVQEVMFKSLLVGEKGKTTSVFFEWDGSKIKEVRYDTVTYREEYGKVFRKYFYNNHAFFEKK